ncbi:MAG: porin, partial [Planctomycetaceae bacterium]
MLNAFAYSAVAVLLMASQCELIADDSIAPSQMGQLIERLDAAEAKIRELESSSTASDSGKAVSYSRRIDENLEKRLDGLENNWIELTEVQTNMQETFDDYFIKDGSSNTSMIISGRIHGDYWGIPQANAASERLEGGDPQDRFVWRRNRFGVKGKIRDNMEYKIEMEFADPNDAEYRDIYIGFNDLPVFQTLLIGNQKRPYGLDHINSSRYNVFLERPFIVEAFNEDARRLGIAAYGYSPDEVWNWRYGVYNGEKTQDDQGYISDMLQLELAGRLASTPWYDDSTGGRSYYHWAVSGTSAWPDGSGKGDAPNVARFRTRPEGRLSSRWLNTDRIEYAQNYRLLGLEQVL